jgi:hypothetical protein
MRMSDLSKRYEWSIIGESYLATSLFLARSICPKSELFDDLGSNDYIFSSLKFRSSHSNIELVWPIVYNLKHGIEVWLKALGNIDHGKFKGVHDLKEIFDFIKAESGINKAVIDKLWTETWPVIEKYYQGTYNPTQSLGNPDKQNECERYPEALNPKHPGYNICDDNDYSKDYHSWFNFKVITQIIDDIKFIEKQFSDAERNITPALLAVKVVN